MYKICFCHQITLNQNPLTWPLVWASETWWKSTRREPNWLSITSTWSSTRGRSPLSSATTEPAKLPPCKEQTWRALMGSIVTCIRAVESLIYFRFVLRLGCNFMFDGFQFCPDWPVPTHLGHCVHQGDGHPPWHGHHPEDTGSLSTTQCPVWHVRLIFPTHNTGNKLSLHVVCDLLWLGLVDYRNSIYRFHTTNMFWLKLDTLLWNKWWVWKTLDYLVGLVFAREYSDVVKGVDWF